MQRGSNCPRLLRWAPTKQLQPKPNKPNKAPEPTTTSVTSPAAQAATSEFMSLFNKLFSCRKSEREAMDLLGKETYDIIFKAGASSPVKGGGGPTRVERVLNDLHDFRDASGFWTSDWVLQVHYSSVRKASYTSSLRPHALVAQGLMH